MKNLLLALTVGLLAIFIVACGSTGDDNNISSNSSETVTITHELGETDVPKNPEKIVVFDFGILDTLDMLEIEVDGVPKSSMLPAYLEKYESDEYENVGSLKEPDFEKIAEIDPDLIIISGRQATLYDQFQDLAATIHLGVEPTRYIDSFEDNMNSVATIFDKEVEVEEALSEINESITSLNEKADSLSIHALIILANDDKISAYGPNSRFGIIHDVFGVPAVDQEIEASTHGMNITFEYVKETNPDLLYVIDRSAVVNGETSAQQIVENRLIESTEAYQNDMIYYLNPDYWYLSGGGLISVKEMIKEIDESLN